MNGFQLDPDLACALAGTKLSDIERSVIIATLEKAEGNRTHAADVLGISIRTLRNKIREYTDQGIAVPAARP